LKRLQVLCLWRLKSRHPCLLSRLTKTSCPQLQPTKSPESKTRTTTSRDSPRWSSKSSTLCS
jgi:hypothetical protein